MDNIIDLRLGRDLRQSPEYGKFMETIRWTTIQIPIAKSQDTNKFQITNSNNQIFVKKIGPVKLAKMRRPGPETSWGDVMKILKQERIFIFQIDPEVDNPEMFKDLGFKKNSSQLLGTKTLLVDVRLNDEEILAGFKQETRYKLRKFQDSGFKVQLNDYEKFYEILKEGYKDLDVWCPPKDQYENLINSFGKNCFSLTIDDLSGCLVLLNQGVAEYYYAASKKAGKENNLPYLVVWEAMKETKKRGVKVWDFNGYYDERYPDKRWKGFSFFKSRFGGVEMEFAGSYTKLGWL
jgi:lipid II:glycine glycyltransferase (peptidoglycan interpeptide bridge formation enzyme)